MTADEQMTVDLEAALAPFVDMPPDTVTKEAIVAAVRPVMERYCMRFVEEVADGCIVSFRQRAALNSGREP